MFLYKNVKKHFFSLLLCLFVFFVKAMYNFINIALTNFSECFIIVTFNRQLMVSTWRSLKIVDDNCVETVHLKNI